MVEDMCWVPCLGASVDSGRFLKHEGCAKGVLPHMLWLCRTSAWKASEARTAVPTMKGLLALSSHGEDVGLLNHDQPVPV